MLTVPEAARRVKRDPKTIRRWIRSGRLPAEKIGTQYLIAEEDLDVLVKVDHLALPPSWEQTITGEPMPNWVALLRRSRAPH